MKEMKLNLFFDDSLTFGELQSTKEENVNSIMSVDDLEELPESGVSVRIPTSNEVF